MGTPGVSYSDLWKGAAEGPGKRHRFRVRDPLAKRYESDCFADYEKGLAWAKRRRKEFIEGRATASSVLWSDLGDQYVATLLGLQCHDRHVAQTRQVVAGLTKAGARSIADDGFPVIAQRWVLHLRGKRTWAKEAADLSPSTKTKFLVIARAICGQAVDRGLMRYNPLTTIRLPKVPRRFRPVHSVPDLRKLVAPKRTPTDCMWRRVAVLLAYTGMRFTEARYCTRAMFDFGGSGYCEVPADHPGNKSRVARRFPIQGELRQELEGDPDGFMVCERIRRMGEGNASNGYKDYCTRCGITPRGPHAMRHTVASLLTATGMSPHLVMDYIGHETASVTKHYSKNADLHRPHVLGWTGHQFRLLSV